MGIEEDFYATLKLNSGEEIFAKVAASEEDNRTMLIINQVSSSYCGWERWRKSRFCSGWWTR